MAEKRTRLSDMTKAGRKAEKPTVIGAIRDPQFVRDVLQGLGETATRGITGVLGAPVDITTMAMRPFGYSVPAEQVVGGSEYLGKQLERAGMLSGNRNQLSELLAGLVTPDPLDVAKLGAMAVPVVGRAIDPATLKQLRTEAISAKDEFDDLYRAIKKRTREPEAEEYFGKSGAMHDAQERLAQSMSNIPDDAFGFQARNNDNMMLMLTPSAQKPGEYQLTRFDRKGQPFGHTEYKTKEHALKDFLYESNLRTVQDSGQYLPEFKTQAPRDEAMRIAQANAAKPISEGGLGLPPDNTAMNRAKAMGYEPGMYHATGADFQEIDLSRAGQASGGNVPAFFTAKGTGLAEDYLPKEMVPKPEYARAYKNQERYQKALMSKYGDFAKQPDLFMQKPELSQSWQLESALRSNPELSKSFESYISNPEFVAGYAKNRQTVRNLIEDLEKETPRMHTEQYATGANVMPMMVQKGDFVDFDAKGQAWTPDLDRKIQQMLREQGLSGVVGGVNIRNIYDGKAGRIADTQMIFNPAAVRSTSAAFDPARRYESDLLGAADPRLLGAIGLGTAGAIYKTNREKEKDRKREK